MRAGFVCHSLRDQCFSGSGWAVHQNPSRRFDAQFVEDLGMFHGKLDHLTHPIDLAVQPADVLVGDAGSFRGIKTEYRFFEQNDVCSLVHQNHALRHGLGHDQRQHRTPERRRRRQDRDNIADQYRAFDRLVLHDDLRIYAKLDF